MAGHSWSISYGDGSAANGDVYITTVNVGGAAALDQAIGLASNVSDAFLKDYGNDGMLGLGFDSANSGKSSFIHRQLEDQIGRPAPTSKYNSLTTLSVKPRPQKTFFTNARSSLKLPLFTVDLKHSAPGSYDFGFIDEQKYSGEITYLDANSSQGYWGVSSTAYGVGGDGSNLTEKKIHAIVDTGTTLLLVPQDVVTAYYDQVKNSKKDDKQGGYVFPCDVSLTDFYIGLDNFTAKVPASAINTGKVGGDGNRK